LPEKIRPLTSITDIHSVSLISADVVIYILEIESKNVDLSKEIAFRHYLYSIPKQYKGRVCMMPGFTEEMKCAVLVDYKEMYHKANILKNIISNKNICIKTKLGTNIQFNIGEREIIKDDGDLSKPGLYGNIPAGEIFTAPIEESINGRIVIDGSVGDWGAVKYPFSIDISSGQIENMQPIDKKDDIFLKFKDLCELDAPATKTVGEFGIGINPGAKIIGNMLIDEKVEGTIHFAFGDSYGLGRTTSKYHTDLLIKEPSIFANNKCFMNRGKFLPSILGFRP
jgi:leucyl aminopeptidase (aminopeptidase T)